MNKATIKVDHCASLVIEVRSDGSFSIKLHGAARDPLPSHSSLVQVVKALGGYLEQHGHKVIVMTNPDRAFSAGK